MADRTGRGRVLFVSFIADAKWTGMGGWTYAVMSALEAQGYTAEAWFADRFPRVSRLGRLSVLLAPIVVARALVGRRREYDAVVLHEPLGFWYGLLRRMMPGLPPMVAMCHNVERHHYEIMRRFARAGLASLSAATRVRAPLTRHWQSNGTIRLADHVICLSTFDASYITGQLHVPSHKVTVALNGVSPEAFVSIAQRPRGHRVVWVGGWLDVKGARVLPRVWRALRARMPDATLTLIGTGADQLTVASAFDAQDRPSITVLPRVESRDRMRDLYASGDAYLMTSLSEGSPLSLLEAMAAGLPVVATRVGGVPDIVDDGRHGLLFDPAQAEQGASALADVLSDAALAEHLSKAGQSHARDLTWTRTADAVASAIALVQHPAVAARSTARTRILFFVEGFTDIRFVVGLSEIGALTLCVPARAYAESGLDARVAASGAAVTVHRIDGGRLAYQPRSLVWLLRHAREFDVIVSQELLRGSLNATLVGSFLGVPVLTTMLLPPVEYFRCRHARGQIGAVAAWGGEAVIRTLMTINGRLTTRCLALGAYLQAIAGRYCPRTVPGHYYGVDTTFFTPATSAERIALRMKRNLPADAFIVLLASRISHEKDPETVLRAMARVRERGLNAVIVNLGGGYEDFIALADRMNLEDAERWVIGQPAAHPMIDLADYFRASDLVVQSSLEEGLGLSPLEALACGVPVVATNVGGMAATLPGFARLVPIQDDEAMAEQILWVADHRDEARAQALKGREMVRRDWSRQRAFQSLAAVIDDVTGTEQRRAA